MNVSSHLPKKELVEKYAARYAYMYAQYPNSSFWSPEIGAAEYGTALRALPGYRRTVPTLLYVHLPFCPAVCHFCSCYRVAASGYARVLQCFSHILAEMDFLASFLHKEALDPNFGQIHLGGGSPTYLKNSEFDQLVAGLRRLLDFRRIEEFALEVDPRHVNPERMMYYRSQGINRISFGIQDFDPEVQKAVNRVQSVDLVERLLVPAVRSSFESVSFDILHGLPKQTPESFRKTMEIVARLSPDRIVLLTFNYSPEQHVNQTHIDPAHLPSALQKAEMFEYASRMLVERGYLRVGVEHFVKPTDKLARLWKSGDFNWNMSGYNRGNANKIIGIGPHSVSRITDDYYFQNLILLEDYESAVAAARFPLLKGHRLSEDDRIRRDVTVGLRSRLFVDFGEVERRHGIVFRDYFARELASLDEFVRDGVIEVSKETVRVTEAGLPFVSFVCMNFDRYHVEHKDRAPATGASAEAP
jgi:oxygen-independent coproporphyrinogen-3 oxidase